MSSDLFGPHDDADWTQRARQVDQFRCDVVFSVAQSFYFGPRMGPTREDMREELPPVPLPCLANGAILGRIAFGHETELVRHYRAILDAAARHDEMESLRGVFPYFRTKAAILEGDAVLSRLPWCDTVSYAADVLEKLAKATHVATDEFHPLLDDVDQGWQLRVVSQRDTVYWLERNWEYRTEDETDVELAFDRVRLACKSRLALDRLKAIHGRLVAAFDRDWWNPAR